MASAPSLQRGHLRETLVHGLITVNLPAAVIESFGTLNLCWSIEWEVANCSTLFTQSWRDDIWTIPMIHSHCEKVLTSKIFDNFLRDHLVWHILILRYPCSQVLTRTFPYLLLQFKKIMTFAKYIFSLRHFCLCDHNWCFGFHREDQT